MFPHIGPAFAEALLNLFGTDDEDSPPSEQSPDQPATLEELGAFLIDEA